MRLSVYQRMLHPLLSSLKRSGGVFFCDRYLLYTNTGISVGLSVLGDSLQQSYQRFKNQQNMSSGHIAWNHKRTMQMAASGLVIGPFVHYWYIYLERWFPGRGLRTLVKKVLVDQIVCSPVYIGLFLISIGILDGQNWSSIGDEFKNTGMTMYVAEFMVWPPAQFFNFYLLPLKFRVLFDSAVSLVMDTYFSYLRFDLDSKSKAWEEAVLPQDNQTEDTELGGIHANHSLSDAQSNSSLKSQKNYLDSDIGLSRLKNTDTECASVVKCKDVTQSANQEAKAVNVLFDRLDVQGTPQSVEEEGGYRPNAQFFSLLFSWS